MRPSPDAEVFCADEGWGPFWIPRSQGHSRYGARKEVAGLTGERPSDFVVRAQRGRVEWDDRFGWWFTVDPAGSFRVWEVVAA